MFNICVLFRLWKKFAKEMGKSTLMLTSRPSRVAANNLYRSCGLEPKETNMYRMPLDALSN